MCVLDLASLALGKSGLNRLSGSIVSWLLVTVPRIPEIVNLEQFTVGSYFRGWSLVS